MSQSSKNSPPLQSQKIVNSWNEWDTLKHVIVGRADFGHIPASEPGFDCRMAAHPESDASGGSRSEEAIAKANNQLNQFCNLLISRDIKVDRPTAIDFGKPVKTPDFNIPHMAGCMPPRDVILTLGSEMLEATMSFRSRWFEYLCYRPLLENYFQHDHEMRWEAAPKPRLTQNSFRPDYLIGDLTNVERMQLVKERLFVTTEKEPLFDAADVARMGKDLFVQHGFTTNLKGIDWLARHFPDHRIHTMHFPGDPMPMHIDCTLVPLRPGLLLVNPDRPPIEADLNFFKDNEWEVITAAKPAHKTSPPNCYSSVWLSMNLFSLDSKTVCVEASEIYQMEQLDKLGFEVIPVPFRDVYPFGGGLHCATADVFRDGQCEDYFSVTGTEFTQI